jgi:hypothetical protein
MMEMMTNRIIASGVVSRSIIVIIFSVLRVEIPTLKRRRRSEG